MRGITNIAVTGEDSVVTYADDSKEEFQCGGTVTTITASLATTLKKERKMRIATGDHLRHMHARGSDMISRGLSDTSTTSTAPTVMNVEFMRLIRTVAPKYDSALPDTDPHIVTLDALRYAPTEAFGTIYLTSMSKIQLGQAIDILEQIGDYTRASNIAPKIISTEDTIYGISADSATFWGKKY